jgi:hypothetical protein
MKVTAVCALALEISTILNIRVPTSSTDAWPYFLDCVNPNFYSKREAKNMAKHNSKTDTMMDE